MRLKSIIGLFSLHFLLQHQHLSSSAPVNSESKRKSLSYLEKFGYIVPQDMRTGELRTEISMKDAIRSFQKMANISVTGELNSETMKMMEEPRCGVSDKIGSGFRMKRYALQGSKWKSTRLYYKVLQTTPDLNKNDVLNIIQQAFQIWSDVTPLSFMRTEKGKFHMNISFVKQYHGDLKPFDGEGQVLAHAFFPQFGGMTHFDDDETWTRESTHGVDLFQVAAHEFGHALGLSHSDVKFALMSPFYKKGQKDVTLHDDDIAAIQELYGPKPEGPVTTTKATKTQKPVVPRLAICKDSRIDAATCTRSGKAYLFKGNHYYLLKGNGVAPGYPKLISTDWGGVSGPIDAALSWRNGYTYIFKGNLYWKFRENTLRLSRGYPRRIYSGFGIDGPVNAAFQWGANGKTYFTKGAYYYKFSPYRYGTTRGVLTGWRGIPDNLDAAVRYKNGRSYFFKGLYYYRYDDKNLRVDSGYPRKISKYWLGCEKMSKMTVENIGDQYNKPFLPDFVFHKRSNRTNQILRSTDRPTGNAVSQGVSLALTAASIACYLYGHHIGLLL